MTTYSLEDIIQSEIAKALSRQMMDEPPVRPETGLGGLDIRAITKLLEEVNKLISLYQAKNAPNQPPAAAGLPPVQPAVEQPKVSAEDRYNQLIEGLETLIKTAGDMKLSELLEYAKENKTDVIELIKRFA